MQVGNFCEGTFYSAIASKHLEEEDIEWILFKVKSFSSSVEYEYLLIKRMQTGYVQAYTTSCNGLFDDIQSVFKNVKQSLKLFSMLCLIFEQVNMKGRCNNVPPGFEPPQLFKHSWLFDSAYIPDAINGMGYPACVMELFKQVELCVSHIDASIKACLDIHNAVEEKREDWEFCYESLLQFCDEVDPLETPSLTCDIDGNIIVPEDAAPLIDAWNKSSDKAYCASKYYHNCSVVGGYTLSHYARQEKKRLAGYTKEEIALYGTDKMHLDEIRLVEKNVDNIFDINGKTVPSNVVYAVVTWAKPDRSLPDYLSLALAHFTEGYQRHGGERKVVKLRALEYMRKNCNEADLNQMHKKIDRFVHRQRPAQIQIS